MADAALVEHARGLLGRAVRNFPALGEKFCNEVTELCAQDIFGRLPLDCKCREPLRRLALNRRPLGLRGASPFPSLTLSIPRVLRDAVWHRHILSLNPYLWLSDQLIDRDANLCRPPFRYPQLTSRLAVDVFVREKLCLNSFECNLFKSFGLEPLARPMLRRPGPLLAPAFTAVPAGRPALLPAPDLAAVIDLAVEPLLFIAARAVRCAAAVAFLTQNARCVVGRRTAVRIRRRLRPRLTQLSRFARLVPIVLWRNRRPFLLSQLHQLVSPGIVIID